MYGTFFFSDSDPSNILPWEETGIGYKIMVKLKFFCTTYASSFCYKILYPS